MPISTIFSRTAPSISDYQFDAVIEDTFENTVEYTTYPIESGADAADHGIIMPMTYTLRGVISNNPLKTQVTDFLPSLSNFTESGVASSILGAAAGLASGDDRMRSASFLRDLVQLQNRRDVISVDAGDSQLNNMVITALRRTKNPTNENGLEFEIDLMELRTIDLITRQGSQPSSFQLRPSDLSSFIGDINVGQVLGSVAAVGVTSAITAIRGF